MMLRTKKEVSDNIDSDSKFKLRCYLCSPYDLKDNCPDYLVIIGTYLKLPQKLDALKNLKVLIAKKDSCSRAEFYNLARKIAEEQGIKCDKQRCRYYDS